MRRKFLILFVCVFLMQCSSKPPGMMSANKDDVSSAASERSSQPTPERTYGFTEQNPIKVGGGPDFGPLREQWFFDHLLGPDGKTVQYERLGSCCSTESDDWPDIGGALDIYEVRYRGTGSPVEIYVDMYECEDPKAPQGFTFLEDTGEFDGKIYFASMSAIFTAELGLHIYELDGNTRCINPLPIQAPDFYPFSIRHGGTQIAYSVSDDSTSRIMIMDLNDGTTQQISPENSWDEMPVWSPDGKQVLFTRYEADDSDIWVYEIDQDKITPLFGESYLEVEPSWAPDGSRLAFTSTKSGNADIYIADIDGTNLQQMTQDDAFDASPVWAPNGQQIAFISDRRGSLGIYVINIESKEVIKIKTPRGDALYPDWSPDGSSIAFCLDDGNNAQIYKVNLDGSELAQLTTSISASCFPEWR